MNRSYLISILLMIAMVVSIPVFSASYTSGGITFYSPVANNEVYHSGQQLILNASTGEPNVPVTIYVEYNGKYVYVNPAAHTNAQGYIYADLGTFGTGSLTSPGTYTIIVSTSGTPPETGTINVVYIPAEATINVEVLNNQNLPVSGATVYLYNVTNGVHTLISQNTTNPSGVATFHVISYNFTQTFEVEASASGYVSSSANVSVIGNQTVNVVIHLYPAILTIVPLYVIQNNSIVDAGTMQSPLQSVVVTQGLPASMIVAVMFAGKPVTNATLSVSSALPSQIKIVSYSPITSGKYAGDYNITFVAAVENYTSVPYEVDLDINATYITYTQSSYVEVQAYYNALTYIHTTLTQLQNEINIVSQDVAALNKSITSLNTTLTSLSQSITTINNDINTLNTELKSVNQTATGLSGTVTKLQSEINSLNGTVGSLSSQVSSLNSKVDGILPLVYGGIIAGIIGLIVAIIAIILVYRKIS
ncbi:carboxypeptidase-like regulatory domain-containing protein [Stygiolobus caldivivus]|uniref:Uncharacterized protein n=1 Tax=Stygiolobus caldivivus TaxID=2824673 RepID=A0A8D5U4W3_9CREN|nr:carboxypeptidase-like regulatory domain-containing protein [Stygiolobus caldivivus]BCU69312.1 hypothetical protein KN1_06090 [Stygiolobus caldivivus]